MVDLYETGVILTLFMIAINSFLIVGDSLPIIDLSYDLDLNVTAYDLNQVNPATTQFAGVTLSSVPLAGVPLAFFNSAISAVLVLGKFLYFMLFGYQMVISQIFEPVGLGILGNVLILILAFIELYVLFMLAIKANAAIRGGSA